MPGTRRRPAGSSKGPARERRRPSEQLEPFGRLERIAVEGLLGQFSHDIELPKDGPAILTGANGTGKSTLLRLVNAVGSGNWLALARLPFDRAALHFADGEGIEVRRTDEELRVSDGNREVAIELASSTGVFPEFDPRRIRRMSPVQRKRYLESLERRRWMEHAYEPDIVTSEGVIFEAKAGRGISEQELLYRERFPFVDEEDRDFLQRIAARFNVHFITEQRLLMRGEDPELRRRMATAQSERREQVAERVTYYSRKLGQEMTVALGEYANVSQREDRGFPQRVAQELMRQRKVTVKELLPLMQEVTSRREALERVGLVESVSEPSFDSGNIDDPSVRIVFKTFAESTLRKFMVLEDFRDDLELFTSFLNRRFVGKRAVPRADKGLTFLLDDERELGPAQLSSGEQQLIVLAYEVLFGTDPGTLLLIDEPEISLHVLWQSTFVDDIAEMGRARNLSFLLATHSPSLIADHRNLMRSLDPAVD